MSHWNHRVWKQTFGEDVVYSIRETYYNDSGEICACTSDPASADSSESIDNLKQYLEWMLKAVNSDLSILDFDNFKFAEGL